MSQENNFYITTTLPYTNSDPHIGFAAEILKADVIARYQAIQGKKVFFNTGSDEHGLKIQQQADEANLSVVEYCNHYVDRFKALKELLNLSFTNFIRTSDEYHQKAAQAFWNLCDQNGDIYKKAYKIKYCVGCELEKTDSELESGRCPFHPNKDLEIIEEENYFFRFSKYQQPLLDFYNNHPDFVVPNHRFTEIKNFVSGGLQDFSISRLKSKMPNGVAVPGDEDQVMYVWFDALVNYISALGWPSDEDNFKDFWPAVQVCGKDNLRQQTAMWQAMLMSAGIEPSRQVLIFGFLTANGQKIGKSLGNSIDPFALVEKFGSEALRYYLLAEIAPFEDSDFSEDKLIIKYNADLANGLGNLVARVSNLLEKNQIKTNLEVKSLEIEVIGKLKISGLEKYQFNRSLQFIWQEIADCNEGLSAQAPWKMTEKAEIEKVLLPLAKRILEIALMLQPFLPLTAEKIINLFTKEQITKSEILFPRLTVEAKEA
jgi:methionyl-tRNA synthetase